MTLPRLLLAGFLAGALGVLVTHQGTVWLLHMGGLLPNPPYSLRPVAPFGVPAVLNAAFWGGLWGVVLAALLRATGWPALVTGLLLGAAGATLIGWTAVAGLKGLPLFAGFELARMWRGPLINGAWGWGAALFLLGLGAGFRR
jgi:hypothetical protein